MTTAEVVDEIAQQNPEALLADGFEEALVGYASQATKKPLAVYDYDKCVEILVSRGASEEDALEHMNFNVTGAWQGEETPLFAIILRS